MKAMRLLFPVVTAALLMATPAAVAQTRSEPISVITGTLLGTDGTPMKLADAQLYRPYRLEDAARATVAPDGRFAIATTDTGIVILRFSGVDHSDARVPLYLGGSATIGLDVRLKRHAYTDSLDRVQAIGDWAGFAPASARPLIRQADGRYTLDVSTTADTLAYQFIGLAAGDGGRRGINGSRGDWYVYDNGGAYRSVLRATEGHATIVLDPSELNRPPARSR